MESKLTAKKKVALEKAKTLVLSDLKRHYTIQEIAKAVQLNEFDLKVHFKTVYGLPIYTFLKKARMEKAMELLNTDMPIKVIAFEIGFSTQNTFIMAFKKHYGHTPASVRKK